LTYRVYYEDRAAKELARLPRPYQVLIKRKVQQIAEDFESQRPNLKHLKGRFDYYRLRIGSYRVIFYKDDKRIVIVIVRIGHRKEIY